MGHSVILVLRAASAAPIFFVLIGNPAGTTSYAGTAGNGIYIWGAEFLISTNAPTLILPFATVTGATLTTNGAATPAGVSGIADQNWGGAFVWLSSDGTTFGQVGQVNAPSRHGVLTASLAAHAAGLDPTSVLSVNLIESGGHLSTATTADAQNGVTLCLVDDELVSYATATLTGTNAYDLTCLYRGLFGTSPAAHTTGATFARLDGAVFQYTLPQQFIGVPLYMKFQSFNIFGNSVEDLSECAVYVYTPNGNGQALGPVAQALAVGTNLDYGIASTGINESDDWGLASSPSNTTIDLGLASS